MKNMNSALWDEVQTTDPSYTKHFQKMGGFSGTAVNAVYLIRKATEKWGPMGGKWGVNIIGEELMQGAPILIDGGEKICYELVHKVQIELRHPDGVVPAFGQTMFVGRNSRGTYTDEEAPKKSLTDAVTKALSWLGFSSDVYLGMYDDNKYVNNLKIAAQEKEQAEKFNETKWMNDFDLYKDVAMLRKGVEKCKAEAVAAHNPEAFKRLKDYATKIAEILKCDNPEALDLVVDQWRESGMELSILNRLCDVAAQKFNKEAA